MRRTRYTVVAALLLTLVGLIGVTYYVALVHAGQETQSWIATEGVVTDSGPGFCRPYLRYTYHNRHNHAFEGRTYRLTSCLTLRDTYWLIHDEHPPGKKVTVYYDPYLHHRAVLQRGAPRGAERILFVALPALLSGVLLLWLALRKLRYPRLDVADAGTRLFAGYVTVFTMLGAVANAIAIFVDDRWTKFGGVAGWISDTLFTGLGGALLAGVMLFALRLNERWLPAIPKNLQLLTGMACGLVAAAAFASLPANQSTIADNFFGLLKLLLILNIPSLVIVLLIGVRRAEPSSVIWAEPASEEATHS